MRNKYGIMADYASWQLNSPEFKPIEMEIPIFTPDTVPQWTDFGPNLLAIKNPDLWVGHLPPYKIQYIKDMITEHLESAIKMIENRVDYLGMRIPDWCIDKLPFLVAEKKRREEKNGWDE